LLDATSGELASVTAEDAYDGTPVYEAVARRQRGPVDGRRLEP
jgi:hypothetical protein